MGHVSAGRLEISPIGRLSSYTALVQSVITPQESSRLDESTSFPLATLMERAGYAVSCAAGLGYGDSVAVLTGKGNNGGDGWVAAFHLAKRGTRVKVHEFAAPNEGSLASDVRERALAAGVRLHELTDVWTPDLVIDALFGVGFSGELPDVLSDWAGTSARVLSIDIPSGVDASTGEVRGRAFTADTTVTFHALKPGLLVGAGAERAGDVAVVDIGLSGEIPIWLLCESRDAPLPQRPRHSHKWSAGSVALVGGSVGMGGAPVLAADAALAAGAGAVTVVRPGGVDGPLPAHLLSHSVGGGDCFTQADIGPVLTLADRFDVLVLGPGAGRSSDAVLAEIAARWPGPAVIDADALRAIADADVIAARSAPTVLTPHAGELRSLRSMETEPVADTALRYGAVIVEKGNPTFIHGQRTWVVNTGGAELATIGTGDVLSGMIGAFLAAGMEPDVAARSAAYWHGVAGARQRKKRLVTAANLIDAVGEVLAGAANSEPE